MPWKGAGGANPFSIQGSADTYALLPTASEHDQELWFVKSPKIFSLHSRGVYYSTGGVWEASTIKVKWSEDAGSVVNWTDWGMWYNGSEDIEIGDMLIFGDYIYRNTTGTQTTTSPHQDALNWDYADGNIIRYYNDLAIDIQPFRVLHAKNVITISGKQHLTPDIADATFHELTQGTLSVSCELIPQGQFGCSVKNTARIKGGDTSFLPAPSQNWLSDDGSGKLTNIKPSYPSFSISMGANLNAEAAPNGEMFVNQTTDIYDIFNDGWDGAIKETFDFLVTSDGATITGTLTNRAFPLNNLTGLFSDVAFYTIDTTTTPLELTLTAGTSTVPQTNFVFIDMATKTLQVSTTGFPEDEHAKIGEAVCLDATRTMNEGVLKNQNWNDHIKKDDNNGHLLHIAEWIRKRPASWDTGVFGGITIGGLNEVWYTNTSGVVYQLHSKIFPAKDMEAGDTAYVVNDSISPYDLISDFKELTLDASGNALLNTSFSIVVYGVANKETGNANICVNLPSDTYNKNFPETAVTDASNSSVYSIPKIFTGVGFLIARFTFVDNGGVWSLYDTEDLRGSTPNTTAGGGAGGAGVTEFTGLTDTPSSYVGQANKIPRVNTLETALDFNVAYLEYTDNADAIANSLTVGMIYRTGDILKVVH